MKLAFRRLAGVVAASGLALGLAACSQPAPTSAPATVSNPATTSTTAAPKAVEIIDKAKANAKAARSGAFKGQITENKETMKLDVKGTNDGKTADATLEAGNEGKVRVVSVGGAFYMQADAAFWKAQGAPVELQRAGDKFVKAPEAKGILDGLTIGEFVDGIFSDVKAGNVSDEVGEETINGVDCWVVYDKGGKEEGSIYVSKDSFQLVRFTGSKDTPGQVDFSSWNEELGIKAPTAAQIISIP